MGFDKTPTTHIPGMLYVGPADGGNPLVQGNACSTIGITTAWLALYVDTPLLGFIIIPLSSMAGLSAAEADEATGDWRYIVRALIEGFFDDYNAMTAANKPTNLVVTESSLIDTATSGESNRTWTVTATLDTGSLEVADE